MTHILSNNQVSGSDDGLEHVQSGPLSAAQRMKAGEWHADLELEVSQRERGARLTGYRRNGPLHVQKAFYPEGRDLAHLYVLHPPGGLVSGDSLTIRAAVCSGSAALITTPGAGRLYGARASASKPSSPKSSAPKQIQNNVLSVKPGASLEWFPMETLFYSGSEGVSHTRIDIAEGGAFMGWDIAALGLPASNEAFIAGEVRQAMEIHYAGKLAWLERWRFNAHDVDFLNSPAGLSGHSSNGVFIAGPFTSPVPENVLNTLRCQCDLLREKNRGYAGVTQVKEWLALRYVGPSATHAREHFVQAWREIRPLLINRTACPPRIWAC